MALKNSFHLLISFWLLETMNMEDVIDGKRSGLRADDRPARSAYLPLMLERELELQGLSLVIARSHKPSCITVV